ncbi:MAG: hypothetical protein EZS28_039459, partial [Streblomastix strix]
VTVVFSQLGKKGTALGLRSRFLALDVISGIMMLSEDRLWLLRIGMIGPDKDICDLYRAYYYKSFVEDDRENYFFVEYSGNDQELSILLFNAFRAS